MEKGAGRARNCLLSTMKEPSGMTSPRAGRVCRGNPERLRGRLLRQGDGGRPGHRWPPIQASLSPCPTLPPGSPFTDWRTLKAEREVQMEATSAAPPAPWDCRLPSQAGAALWATGEGVQEARKARVGGGGAGIPPPPPFCPTQAL